MNTTTVVIGLTQSARTGDYFPMSDGYREGAAQQVVSVEVETGLLVGKSIEAVAEAVFEATNAPVEVFARNPLACAILEGLLDPMGRGQYRSLSVGDTVCMENTLGEEMTAECKARGVIVDGDAHGFLIEFRDPSTTSKWKDEQGKRVYFENGALIDIYLRERGYE